MVLQMMEENRLDTVVRGHANQAQPRPHHTLPHQAVVVLTVVVVVMMVVVVQAVVVEEVVVVVQLLLLVALQRDHAVVG